MYRRLSYEWQNKIKWNTEKTRVKQRKTMNFEKRDTTQYNSIVLVHGE